METKVVGGGITIEIPGLEARFDRLEKLIGEKKKKPRHCTLIEACQMKGVKYGSIRGEPLRQPQIGFSVQTHGTKKYYPMEAVELWLKVFDYNLAEYIQMLLEDEDRRLAEGVRAQLYHLRQRDLVSERLWREIRNNFDPAA